MTRTQSRILWGATATIGLLLIGASIYLGLEKADKLSSILSGFFGLISSAIGIYQIVAGAPSNRPPAQSQTSGNNSVNIQSGQDLHIGNGNKFGNP
ncbi:MULTISPECIES: hypothetical protein [Streptomyces]|uniref:Uncharacterized protein n=1 Tax=Streptomyces microflavus TaxID=1919 RepID=A0ABV1Q1P9_STRMI|nr:hypothetical protein [Streptomyces sp. 09ZI22]MBW3357752.1 hypothetical protein [Streptomyces sp. 09ZI22]